MVEKTIPVQSVLLPPQKLDQAKRLVGFDYNGYMYHILLFDFGVEGGALGIWKEGDNFCARIALDALAHFNEVAKALHQQGTG